MNPPFRSPVIAPGTAGVVLVLCIAAVVWYMHDTLLLVFAGALIALVLRGAAEQLARSLRVPVIAGVWLTVLAAVAIGALGIALLGNAVALQIGELRYTLPSAIYGAIGDLRATLVGTWIANNLPDVPAIIPDSAHLLTRATGILSGAVGMVAAALIMVFVGIAGALEPTLYASGFVQLVPASYRGRVRGVLVEIGRTLRTWLLARLLTMTVTGTLVTIGLTILHVPLAGALGMLAGALAFIPNIGAIVAATPAVLLAFAASPKSALAVILMYVIVHILDDFIIAPFVERKVVELPPILTLVAQIVLGVAAGAVGIMLAAPIVAAIIVLVRRLWIEDISDRVLATPEQTDDVKTTMVLDLAVPQSEVSARGTK